MAVADPSLRVAAVEHAVGILTAFTTAIPAADDEIGETFFEMLDELAEQACAARDRLDLGRTIIALCSIAHGLLEACAQNLDICQFELLAGIAQVLYGSL